MKKLILILIIPFFISCSKDDDISADEQLAIDEKIIDSYLSENEIDADEHFSGIRFVNGVIGTGSTPELNSTVYAKISSRLLNGTTFYESIDGEVLIISSLLEALKFMIPEMREGGKMTIYAPSFYCFGTQSSEVLPANSIIIFEIELISIIDNAEEQFAVDTLLIENYMERNDVSTFTHESGIRYSVESVGLGASPTVNDEIQVKYKGTFFNGNVFDQNTEGIVFPLGSLIEAWKIMIPTMKVGGKIVIYAPSKYCYGTSGAGSIPPNTNLIFEIELVSLE